MKRTTIRVGSIGIALVATLLIGASFVLADTTSATLPTAVTQGTLSGSTASWINLNNILLDDGSFAVSTGNGYTPYASTTAYGFAIPAGATINGFVVTIKKKGTNDPGNSAFVHDQSLKLMKAGAVVGTDKADTTTNWSSTLTSVTYGSSSDLWGTTWTSSDVNDANFGAAFSPRDVAGDVAASGSVDDIRITVTYTPSVATSPHATVTQTKGITTIRSGTVIIP